MKRIFFMLAGIFFILASPAFGQVVSQGFPGVTSDARAWPFKIVFGGAQIDPRDMSDRAGRLVGKITFDGAQPVTQSGAWSISFTAAQHIICDSGCGSPPSVADSQPFTFGTTSVSIIGAVVDDVGTNTVAENSYGAPRMSTNRELLVNCTTGCSGSSGVAVATLDPPTYIEAATVPLSTDLAGATRVTGTVKIQNSGTPVQVWGTLANNDFMPTDTNLGVLPAVANAAAPTYTEGNQVLLSTTLAGALRVAMASVPLPAGAATSAIQTDRTQKTQLTDGVRDGTIKAASTAAVAGDTSYVMALSPNSPLPGFASTPTVTTKAALTFNAPTSAAVGVASAQALAANGSRKSAVFVNTSSATISCSVAQTAVLNAGVTLVAGASWTMNEYTFGTGAVNCIASAAASNLSIQEMQ